MDLLVHSHILLMLCLEVWRERRVEESSGEENGYRLSCLNVFKIEWKGIILFYWDVLKIKMRMRGND